MIHKHAAVRLLFSPIYNTKLPLVIDLQKLLIVHAQALQSLIVVRAMTVHSGILPKEKNFAYLPLLPQLLRRYAQVLLDAAIRI